MTQKANLSFKNKFPSISVIDAASDFKFGMQLGFTKANHEIRVEEKVGVVFPEIWDFPFNVSVTAEASDIKFGTQLGFAKAHHKTTPRGSRRGLGLRTFPNIWGFL